MFRQKIQNSPYLFDETNRIVGLKQADSSEVLFHGLVTKTPVNAVAGKTILAAADIAVLTAGDTVVLEGNTFTMVASSADEGEFVDGDGLKDLIEGLADWVGTIATGAVTATYAIKGLIGNGRVVVANHAGAVTANGGEAAKSTGTIAAACLARLAVGDQVTFAGDVYTKAAATSVENKTFANTAGLIQCLGALDDWTAAADGSDVVITAAENGAENDDVVAMLVYKRTTAGGVNGTLGIRNEICSDATYLYPAIGGNTIHDANWRRVALGNVY